MRGTDVRLKHHAREMKVEMVDPKMLGMLKEVQEQFENPQWCFLMVGPDFLRHRLTGDNVDAGFAGKPIRFSLMAAQRVAKELQESPLRLEPSIIPEILSEAPSAHLPFFFYED